MFGPEGGDFWIIQVTSTPSDTLHVGVYESTLRSADASHPGLDVGGQGHGCNMATGRFEIDEIERDAGGNITTLDLAFEQHCEGNEPAVFGELRYNAAAGYALATVSPATLDFGSTSIHDTSPTQQVTVTSAGTSPVTIGAIGVSGAHVAEFPIVSETCPAGALAPNTSCQIAVRASPLALGARVATLDIALGTIRGQRSIPLAVTGITPVAEIAWGTTRNGGRNYTWNIGQSMARTASTTSAYLHTTMTTDRVGGSWVDDNGPYAGVYYSRTRNAGETWTTSKRLNPSSRHGSRGSIAASGKYVYATWVSTTRWIAYKGSSPRILYLRRNSNHGSSTAWGSTIRLTSTTGRVDWPTVAAAGANVYVAYTNSATGEIKIKISRDRASTWSTKTLGTTNFSSTSGRVGLPRIATSGNTIVVSWLANDAGAVRARVSLDAGRTWNTASTLVSSSTDLPAVAARGTKVAVAWTAGTGAAVRTWTGGTWSSTKTVGAPSGKTYTASYGPAVALSGTTGIAVAWSGCVTSCTSFGTSTKVDLVWSESSVDGTWWYDGQVIGSSAGSAARRVNDYASIVWPSAGTRYVLWNAAQAGTSSYRVVLRTGVGVVDPLTATRAAPATPNEIAGSEDGPVPRMDASQRHGSAVR